MPEHSLRLRTDDRRTDPRLRLRMAAPLTSSPVAAPLAQAHPGVGTFVAGRRRGDFWASSLVRTHAQPHSELESIRARVPYMARRESSPATVLRTGALQSRRARFLVAYGARHRTAQRLAQRKPHEGIYPMSWRPQRTTPQATLLRRQSEMIPVTVHPGV